MLSRCWRGKGSDRMASQVRVVKVGGSLLDLPKLESVNLHGSQVRDVGVLASLPKLRYVDLMNTQITDVRPLTGVLKRGGTAQVNPELQGQIERLRRTIGSE